MFARCIYFNLQSLNKTLRHPKLTSAGCNVAKWTCSNDLTIALPGDVASVKLIDGSLAFAFVIM